MLSKILTGFLLVVGVSLGVCACASDASATPQPPTIHYGEDVCEFCGMIVSEERFAAGYVLQDGTERVFDDIGDMIQQYLREPGQVAALFVHEYNEHTWIRAETAYYVHSDHLTTPMLSGLAAFAGEAAAQQAAADLQGQVMQFEDLLTHYRQHPSTPFAPPEDGHNHSGMDMPDGDHAHSD
ncbi:MAG: hypothetical protein D6784_16710 [Chloroflexi bacterium]|nr:MAG: hypothetical protein D6784_16710 [Chloroflexota bacterium]